MQPLGIELLQQTLQGRQPQRPPFCGQIRGVVPSHAMLMADGAAPTMAWLAAVFGRCQRAKSVA